MARALAQAGREVVILEKNAHIGQETSARNSEVIHAGIYYPQNSLKASFCVEGRERLYAFCESHGVGHKRLGKLIVATHADQNEQLAAIMGHAASNGVTDLTPVERDRGRGAGAGTLRHRAGLFSPSTGIIDSHAYMLALLGDAEAAGAGLVRNAEVTAVARNGQAYRLGVRNAGEVVTLAGASFVVNSAGLWAPRVAGLIEALDRKFVPPTFLAKGNYVTSTASSPFRHLVYPVPEPGGLGVHLTLDMARRGAIWPQCRMAGDR